MNEKKTILITGATDGIGKATAIALANKGNQIILTGRQAEKCAAVKDEIVSITGNSLINTLCLELTDRNSIQNAGNFLNAYMPKIDVLINNAGCYETEFSMIENKYEKTFFVNHLGPFYFTYYVLKLMNNNFQSRIVNVSSMAHSHGINLKTINDSKAFQPGKAYSNSKLANILFSFKLARFIENEKTTVNCLHPGVINTKLLRAGWGNGGKPLSEGISTIVFLTLSDSVKNISGKYFADSAIKTPASIAFNQQLQDELWDYSLQVFGLKKFI